MQKIIMYTKQEIIDSVNRDDDAYNFMVHYRNHYLKTLSLKFSNMSGASCLMGLFQQTW